MTTANNRQPVLAHAPSKDREPSLSYLHRYCGRTVKHHYKTRDLADNEISYVLPINATLCNLVPFTHSKNNTQHLTSHQVTAAFY